MADSSSTLVPQLIAQIEEGSHQAAARLISLVEDGDPRGFEALRSLSGRGKGTYSVGITGPPGAGKSTLVDALIGRIRQEGATVGIIAVDPTSPFTGGAVLGDRVRMQDHSTDPGVFVRSMATRGHPGGLAPATTDVIRILDVLGCAFVLIETVGAGQGEIDVVTAADTVVVVTVPGLGDALQALKAGVMEIGDIFVVNKADRPDADRAVTEIKMILGLAPDRAWIPPVVKTVATSGEGTGEVLDAVRRHRAHLEQHGRLAARREQRRRHEILRALETRIRERVLAAGSSRLDALIDAVAAGDLDPHAAADRLLADVDQVKPP